MVNNLAIKCGIVLTHERSRDPKLLAKTVRTFSNFDAVLSYATNSNNSSSSFNPTAGGYCRLPPLVPMTPTCGTVPNDG